MQLKTACKVGAFFLRSSTKVFHSNEPHRSASIFRSDESGSVRLHVLTLGIDLLHKPIQHCTVDLLVVRDGISN